jgi:glycosyltransferase involved in cell wall biosynthesis
MILSIITPCSRPLNLPTIYWSILNMKTDNIEWIIVYDGDKIDERILQYQENIPIKLFNKTREIGDSYGAKLRNIGIENAVGDYLYYLDDDNLIHPKLYDRISRYSNDDNTKILVFNQFNSRFGRRLNKLNINCVNNGGLDTAQFVVPRKYKTRWTTEQKRYEEIPYFKKLIEEAGQENIIWIDRLYTYRNYLRRYEIK